MLPSLRELVRGYQFFARRHGLTGDRSAALAEALDLATRLASDREQDEPAALLYALTLHPRTLENAWTIYPVQLAKNRARALGAELRVPPDEIQLEDLRLAVVIRRATFEDMRTWVAGHLHPIA